MTPFTGSGVALVTPFQNDSIDYDQVKRLIEWHIAEGTDAIIVSGTTGESATLSLDEKRELIQAAVQYAGGRIPVIAGTGGNNTADAVALSVYAQSVGADGLLLVTPYYNKGTQGGLIQHFTTIADAVSCPIILYNVPSRTGVNLLPETVLKLSEHRNIIGIKEASGDISQVAKIIQMCPLGFAVYSGNDDQIIPILSLGGVGVISVLANVMPKATHEMVTPYLSGRTVLAVNLQMKLLRLIHALFIEVNPIPVKRALNKMGISVGTLRLPLTEMEPHNARLLEREMIAQGLLSMEVASGSN